MYNLTTDKKFSRSTFMSKRASQSLLTMRTQRELVILLQLDIGPPQACCQTHVMGLVICWSFGGGGGGGGIKSSMHRQWAVWIQTDTKSISQAYSKIVVH